MVRLSTLCRGIVVGSIGWVTAVGCESSGSDSGAGSDTSDPRVDIVLESSNDALGAASTSAGFLSIQRVELVACDDAGALHYRLFAMNTAWAHVKNTPTSLGGSVLDALAGSPSTAPLGTLVPPRVSFCSVRVTFGPADGDALGMPSDRAPVGRTLWVVGRAGDPVADFKLTTNETRTVDLPVARFRAGDHGHRSVVRLSRAGGGALAGVDLSPSAIAESSRVVLDRLVNATHAEVQ